LPTWYQQRIGAALGPYELAAAQKAAAHANTPTIARRRSRPCRCRRWSERCGQDRRNGSPTSAQRYQLANHLGSTSPELDAAGGLISYEEYSPYGNSTYQAGRSAAEVSLERYRYTGKERDEETGFNYHSARYFAPWLGIWLSPDPEVYHKKGLWVARKVGDRYKIDREKLEDYVDAQGVQHLDYINAKRKLEKLDNQGLTPGEAKQRQDAMDIQARRAADADRAIYKAVMSRGVR
jgi:RHS repeat-associated protein